MAKRARTATKRGSAPEAAKGKSVVQSSLYLPGPVHEALREIAFRERLKIHDVIIEGIDAALRRRGYPSIESLKAGKKR